MELSRTRIFLIVVIGFGCGCSHSGPVPTAVTLATTTSAQDSGLLDVVLPAFEKQSGIKVKVVAVGSGQALELGRRGDADILLTHSPDEEKKFVDEGWGLNRRPLMHNDFIIVGPAEDPAGIQQIDTVVEALRTISARQSVFISRGDESGTHKKELALWKAAEITPQGAWYISSGAGMALSLRIAHEKRGYILTDRGTYLSLKNEIDLLVGFGGDPMLLNRYSVMVVNPGKHPHLHHAEAVQLADFLVSPSGQEIIRTFGVERYGQPLFVPDVNESALK